MEIVGKCTIILNAIKLMFSVYISINLSKLFISRKFKAKALNFIII